MQWLTLVSEDAGVQRLKADNRKPVVTGSVDALSPYPGTHPVQLGERRQADERPRVERRSGDRRQGERRKKQVPVLLDTRAKHDRRAIEGRRQAETGNRAADLPARRRINLYA